MKKAIIVLLLAFSMFFCSVIPSHATNTSFSSKYAWRDDVGNVIFQVVDKKKTSVLHYKTVGISLSRCVLGSDKISKNHEYIVFPFNSNKVKVTSEDLAGGLIKTLFKIPESELLTRIATYYPDWLYDVQCGEVCYIEINSVMICADSKEKYGFLYDDNSRTGLCVWNTYWNVIDMHCSECDGTMPPLKAGFNDEVAGNERICYGHPNIKDGDNEPFM